MKKTDRTSAKLLKELNGQLKTLEQELVHVKTEEGIDDNVTVVVKDNQASLERIRSAEGPDKGIGHFLFEIFITAKANTIFIPLSIASGKKVTGFMYQIEGTGAGTVASASIKCRGEGVTEVTVGTLVYVKIPAGKTGIFRIQATVRGQASKSYNISITRINYKLKVSDARYQQYRKEIVSRSAAY